MLYDAPLYRDWMFWLTAFWAIMMAWAIGSSEPTNDMPVWLDTTLAVLVFTTALGVVPAVVRLQVRKWRWRRRQSRRGVTSAGPQTMHQPTQPPSLVEAPSAVQRDPLNLQRRAVVPEEGPPQRERTMPLGRGSERAPEAHGNVFPLPVGEPQSASAEALQQARILLPYPAARAVRSLSLAANPRDQYEGILDAGEALTLTLG
jgi:hypothetical protein